MNKRVLYVCIVQRGPVDFFLYFLVEKSVLALLCKVAHFVFFVRDVYMKVPFIRGR